MGYDPRESVGLIVFIKSLLDRTTLPVELVCLTPLISEQLGIRSDGTNSFSKIRFAVPYLCGYSGFAIWCDGSDMALRSDLEGLWALRQGAYAIQVVKHDYRPAKRKYVGTELESENSDYPRKNWSSLILWNCGHHDNRHLTPTLIRASGGPYLQRFGWLKDSAIGSLPSDWNHLVSEQPYDAGANLVHHTLGIPGFEYYSNVDYAEEWRSNLKAALRGLQTNALDTETASLA